MSRTVIVCNCNHSRSVRYVDDGTPRVGWLQHEYMCGRLTRDGYLKALGSSRGPRPTTERNGR